jgi:hypothetical protein
MFESIKSLQPYFFSLREIENNVSLDIKLPLNWVFESTTQLYSGIKTKVQDKNERFSLLSLIATSTAEGYKIVFDCAKEIVNINLEEEEKKRLFEQKVNELKMLFQHGSLDKLKEINFIEEYVEQDTTRIGLVESRNETGRETDTNS